MTSLAMRMSNSESFPPSDGYAGASASVGVAPLRDPEAGGTPLPEPSTQQGEGEEGGTQAEAPPPKGDIAILMPERIPPTKACPPCLFSCRH